MFTKRLNSPSELNKELLPIQEEIVDDHKDDEVMQKGSAINFQNEEESDDNAKPTTESMTQTLPITKAKQTQAF